MVKYYCDICNVEQEKMGSLRVTIERVDEEGIVKESGFGVHDICEECKETFIKALYKVKEGFNENTNT